MLPADTRVSRVLLSLSATCGVSLGLTSPSAAQAREPVTLVQAVTVAAADFGAPPAATRAARVPAARPAASPAPAELPRVLLPLYVSFGLLQVVDAHSTLRAVRGGAVERNPLMAPLSSNPGGMFAVKGATAAGMVVLAEKLRRRHPATAVAVMVAINAAYAAIVAANYRK